MHCNEILSDVLLENRWNGRDLNLRSAFVDAGVPLFNDFQHFIARQKAKLVLFRNYVAHNRTKHVNAKLPFSEFK